VPGAGFLGCRSDRGAGEVSAIAAVRVSDGDLVLVMCSPG
jgi:hypothetical protein